MGTYLTFARSGKAVQGASLFTAVAVLLTFASSCDLEASGTPNGQSPDEPAHQAAVVVSAKAVEYRPVFELSGVLEPAERARVAFVVGGRLSVVGVRRGQTVEEGTVLGRLDAAEVRAGVEQARATVAAARSQVDLAEDALSRLEPLSESGALPEVEVIKARHQRDAARAMLSKARAVLQMTQVKSQQHVLRSPLSGTVLEAPETLGEIVGPGIPQFEVATLDTLRIRGSLPPEASGRVAVGQAVTVHKRGGGELSGQLILVLPALDRESHRLPVEVEVTAPPEGPALANSFVRVSVASSEPLAVAALPATAIVRGDETEVFIVESGAARRREVTIVATEGDRVFVLGIDSGARVVDVPAVDLADGALVE